MKRLANRFANSITEIGVVTLLSVGLFAQQPEQSTVANNPKEPLRTEIKHMGGAEVKTVVKTGFFPSRQPEAYWHDQDWNIDLIIPPSKDSSYSLSIRSGGGAASIVKLPDLYVQINSISRAPGEKAIVDADCGAELSCFAVVDLKQGKIVDDVGASFTVLSPDRRFIVFKNWFPPNVEAYENDYRIYDILKTPRQNVCGYSKNDPDHKGLHSAFRGFQVYPQKPGQVLCTNDNDDEDDDNMATNFVWSADSSKIVFADMKSGVMSLVLVTMPVNPQDLPRTSVYPLTGREDVCAGATDAAGDKNCDYHIIQSLGWESGAVKAVFHHQFGAKVDLDVTIPSSQFVPISNQPSR